MNWSNRKWICAQTAYLMIVNVTCICGWHRISSPYIEYQDWHMSDYCHVRRWFFCNLVEHSQIWCAPYPIRLQRTENNREPLHCILNQAYGIQYARLRCFSPEVTLIPVIGPTCVFSMSTISISSLRSKSGLFSSSTCSEPMFGPWRRVWRKAGVFSTALTSVLSTMRMRDRIPIEEPTANVCWVWLRSIKNNALLGEWWTDILWKAFPVSGESHMHWFKSSQNPWAQTMSGSKCSSGIHVSSTSMPIEMAYLCVFSFIVRVYGSIIWVTQLETQWHTHISPFHTTTIATQTPKYLVQTPFIWRQAWTGALCLYCFHFKPTITVVLEMIIHTQKVLRKFVIVLWEEAFSTSVPGAIKWSEYWLWRPSLHHAIACSQRNSNTINPTTVLKRKALSLRGKWRC